MSSKTLESENGYGAAQLNADYDAIIRHSSLKGYQAAALITPPLYTLYTLVRRRPFTVNRFLRATWIGTAGGTVAGAAAGWGRLRNATPESIQDRRVRLAYNTSQIRTDDHSTIGSILFAILTPAIFWRRARVVHLLLGGAGLGSAFGVLVHLGRSLNEGSDVKPEGMRDVVEGAVKGDT